MQQPGRAPPENWPSQLQGCIARLHGAGFDLIQPFAVASLEARLPQVPSVLAERASGQVALLIGNTRALWSAFCASSEAQRAVNQEVSQGAAPVHPLDQYVERVLSEQLEPHLAGNGLAYAHVTQAPVLPIQKLASLAGLTHTGPSHLSIHSDFGPWVSLRAVAVLNGSFCWSNFAKCLVQAQEPYCLNCSAPCIDVFEAALAGGVPQRDGAYVEQPHPALSPTASRWLKVRQACPVGSHLAFGPRQTRYHYDKTLGAIAPEVQGASSPREP